MLSTIDANPPTYSPPGLPFLIYQPWFSLGDLSDGQHTIKLEFSTAVYFDYATVGAGQSTPLQGRTIIVDDQDGGMNYTGNWLFPSDQTFKLGDGLERIPYGKSVHQSKSAGDYVVFQFTGSSISVYGIVQWQFAGHVSTAYIVDGSNPITASIDSEGDSQPYTDQPNYLFFHTDLEPGNHTLVVTVTEITEAQSFTLDYVLYNSSFPNLMAKPNLTPADIHPWTPPPLTLPHGPVPVGGIVGGVVGGVLLLSLMAFLFWRLKRRKRARPSRQREEIDPSPEPAERPSQPPPYAHSMSYNLVPRSDSGDDSAGTNRSPEHSSTGAPSTYNPSLSPVGPRSPVYEPYSPASIYSSSTPSSNSITSGFPSEKKASKSYHESRHIPHSSIFKSEAERSHYPPIHSSTTTTALRNSSTKVDNLPSPGVVNTEKTLPATMPNCSHPSGHPLGPYAR